MNDLEAQDARLKNADKILEEEVWPVLTEMYHDAAAELVHKTIEEHGPLWEFLAEKGEEEATRLVINDMIWRTIDEEMYKYEESRKEKAE